MRTIVIPDVHEDVPALNRLLAHAGKCDKTVFVGDWLDSFNRTPETTQQTLEWLLENVDNPAYTFLFGNHDLQYAFPNVRELRCSGYSTMTAVRFMPHGSIWKNFKLHTWVDSWLVSHAGVSDRAVDITAIDGCLERNLDNLKTAGVVGPALGCGHYRGGDRRKGGVTWLDFLAEFEPLDDIKQVVGHTHMDKPLWKGDNVCIDCSLKFYAVIEDGKLEVVEVA